MKLQNILDSIKKAWDSRKGRTIIVSGGCALAVAIVALVAVSNVADAEKSADIARVISSSASLSSVSDSSIPVSSVSSETPSSDSTTLSSSSPASTTPASSTPSSTASVSSSSSKTKANTGAGTKDTGTKDTGTKGTGTTGAGTTGAGTTGTGTTGTTTTGTPTTGGGTTGTTTTGTAPAYKGVDVTRTFTDEINPSVQQTVQFLGMGANHSIVAAANINANTTAAMGQENYGPATFTITGPFSGSGSGPATILKDGSGGHASTGSLPAGTYTVTLTSNRTHATVAQYHFTVKADGTVD